MKKIIHYALILDQSGSMKHIEKEVVLSFNEQVEMIRKIKKKEQKFDFKITLCTFNDEIEFRYIAQGIDQLNKLNNHEYQPNSCTALYDAMGITMFRMEEIIQPADKIFLAIFTDGLENASTIYTAKDIRYKLNKAEKDGWQIQFFCRYEDKYYYKKDLGLNDDLQYCISQDEKGLKAMENDIAYKLSKIIK